MFQCFTVRRSLYCASAPAWRLAGLFILFTLRVPAQDQPCWLRDASSPSASTVYLLCEQGTVWTSADAGAKWTARNTGATTQLRALAFLDANRGMVVGNGGTVLATGDGGKTWQPRQSGTTEHLLDVTFIGDEGWIAGYQGVMLHSADGGRTWAKQKTGTTQALEGIFFLDRNHGWAVGWAGTILRTVDGGENWLASKTNAASWSLTSICFRDPNNGWLVGFAGQLLRSSDGGVTWTAQTTPVKSWLTNVAFDNANRGWITYDDGLLVSEDAGKTWRPVKVEGRYFLARLVNVNQSLWALGQSVVLRQTGSGLEWKRVDTLTPSGMSRELQSGDPSPAIKQR